MRVVYLACDGTISSSANRRADAFEHDQEFGALKSAFERSGDTLLEADWRQPLPKADAYFIRTLWDYWNHFDAFMSFLEREELTGRLFNSPAIVRDNISKRYLARLQDRDLPVIPSLFLSQQTSLEEIEAKTGWRNIVVKPIVGAGGEDQERITIGNGNAKRAISPELFIQPFLSDIFEAGEISLLYFNGDYSHALLKTNTTGDYRIQSLYGGVERPYEAPEDLIELGAKFIAELPELPLACRVDFIPTKENGYQLMELEAIEPYLYPDFRPDFGDALHHAIKTRL